ncbi:hypothetical protein ACROYT_G018764 [Oculina patagonica]
MFSESLMAATLEFIYTGHVPILAEDIARDLIAVMADYLILQKLKSLVEGVLAQKLNTSNCFSTYYFSERYQCEELLSKTKKFILANFTAVFAANREDVLNMSSKEIEMWISSDEIEVSAEEDVFKIILAWINHDHSKRKRYFDELFLQVRLVYVSRDFLSRDVVTNNLVKDNEGSLELVNEALNLIDSTKNCDNLVSVSVPPRKSLESPAILMHKDADFLCFLPNQNTWCRLGEIPYEYEFDNLFFCEGKLYSTNVKLSLNAEVELSLNMATYNPYTNSWMKLPSLENRRLWKIFVRNEDEMYALLCDACCPCRNIIGMMDSEHILFISKYKPESHSWKAIAPVDCFHPDRRRFYCIVAHDHFIYFIGGEQCVKTQGFGGSYNFREVSDVDRYDLSKNQWDKVADIQEARSDAFGASANGKIFIAGGYVRSQDHKRLDHSYEMYDETTNEWQFIATTMKPEALNTLLAAGGKLYAVGRVNNQYWAGRDLHREMSLSVECYDPEKNEWEMKSETTFCVMTEHIRLSCTLRIFKGLSNIRPLENSTSDSLCNSENSEAIPE